MKKNIFQPNLIVPTGYRNNQPSNYQSSIENPGPQFDFQEEFSKPTRNYPNNEINSKPIFKTTTNYAQQIFDDENEEFQAVFNDKKNEFQAPGFHNPEASSILHNGEDLTPYLNSYDPHHENSYEGKFTYNVQKNQNGQIKKTEFFKIANSQKFFMKISQIGPWVSRID